MVHSVAKLLPMSENRFKQLQKFMAEHNELQLVSKLNLVCFFFFKQKRFLTIYCVIKLKIICNDGLVFLNDVIIVLNAQSLML